MLKPKVAAGRRKVPDSRSTGFFPRTGSLEMLESKSLRLTFKRRPIPARVIGGSLIGTLAKIEQNLLR